MSRKRKGVDWGVRGGGNSGEDVEKTTLRYLRTAMLDGGLVSSSVDALRRF